MSNPKQRNYQVIIWHVIAISVFITYEILFLRSAKMAPGVQSLIVIYSRDVLFFLIIGCVYLPLLWVKIQNAIKRLLTLGLIIIGYTFCICVSGLIYQSIKQGILISDLSDLIIIAASYRAVYVAIIATAYSFARYSIAKTKEAYEQRLLKALAERRMENNFIRSQVNPHLFYSGLSFLYTRTLERAPDLAHTVELMIGMTEYALANEKEDDEILFREEIAQMERYVDLQQTLNENELYVSFNTTPNTMSEDIFLPPLLFMNFIDNIFKYGDLSDPQKPALIEFSIDGKTLKFSSMNKISNFHKSISKGIGLVNGQARIKKHFGEQAQINIAQTDTDYKVEITIQL